MGNESRVTALMQPGSGVGSYVVESLVAKRSEGIVLRARHPSLRRSVTLELIGPPISSAPGYRERFLSAWRIAASLDHPGIITVYDAGEHHGHLFAATDEGPGVDLAALVAAHGPLAPARAARLIAAAAGALDAAYAHGLVHSGLTMQHLIVSRHGDDEHVRVTGFHADGGRDEQLTQRPDLVALERVLTAAVGDGPSEDSLRTAVRTALAEPDLTERSGRSLAALAVAAVPQNDGNPVIDRRAPRPLRRMFAWATVIAVLASVVAAVTLNVTGSPDDRVRATAVGAAKPTAVPVGDLPWDLALGGGYVWVSSFVDGTVARIDPRRHRLVGRPTRIGGRSLKLASGEGALWAASAWDDTVSRLDLRTGRRAGRKIPVGDEPGAITVGAGSVWTLDLVDGTVTRIDPRTMRAAAEPIVIGTGEPDGGGLAFAGGRLWVSEKREGTVTAIDPRTGEVVGRPIPVGREPEGLSGAGDTLWVAVGGDGTVVRVDARTARVARSAVKIGGYPHAIAAQDAGAWVSTLENGIHRVEADGTSRRVASVGHAAYDIVTGAEGVWVPDYRGSAVVRVAAPGADG